MGISSLEVPPLAQAKAVIGGLRVRAVHHVPVGRMNAVRKSKSEADLIRSVKWY